ncbi:MAG: kinase/pyrophosphorylase, partial [Devosiaceae bacterium]|nr:kinase/pyrophosphorylase [Devosiaceae bacterium MH13]
NRVLNDFQADPETDYTDRSAVAEEIAQSRRLCGRHGWPMIDVTRRSIEETAAAILVHYREHRERLETAADSANAGGTAPSANTQGVG